MGTVFRHAVNGIHRRKNGLSPCFHIGRSPGIADLVAMLVIYIQRQIAVGADFISPGLFHTQKVPVPGKHLGGIADSFFTEGDGIFISIRQVNQGFSQRIIHLKPEEAVFLRGLHQDFIPLLICTQHGQAGFLFPAAHAFYLPVFIDHF